MRVEPDALTIDNASNGNNIVSTGPVSGQGTASIPRGVQSARIRVNPQNPNGTSVYNVNLQFNDERVFVKKETKFLGITIGRKTAMESAKESARNIQKRNNDASSTNDINDGTQIKDLYEKQHGPVNTGSTNGGGSLR